MNHAKSRYAKHEYISFGKDGVISLQYESQTATSRLLDLIIQYMMVQGKVSKFLMEVFLGLFFITNAYSMMHKTWLTEWLSEIFFDRYKLELLGAGILYVAVLIFMHLYCIATFFNGGKPGGVLTYTVLMGCWFRFVLFPILVMFSVDSIVNCINSDHCLENENYILILKLTLLVVLSLTNFIISRLRSNIPSRAPNSFVSPLMNVFFLMNFAASEIISRAVDIIRATYFPVYVVMTVLSIALIAFNLYLLLTRGLLWNVELNQFAISGCTRLLVLKIFSEVFHKEFSTPHLILFVIVQDLAAKLFCRIAINALMINIFDSNISFSSFYKGVIYLQQFLNMKETEYHQLSFAEKKVFLYFMGLWTVSMRDGKIKDKSLELIFLDDNSTSDEASRYVANHRNLIRLVSLKEFSNPDYYKLLSMLLATEVTTCILNSRRVFQRYQQLNGTGFFNEIECYEMLVVWKNKLVAIDAQIYSGKRQQHPDVFDSMEYLDALYTDTSCFEDPQIIDVKRVFDSIEKFHTLSTGVEKLLHEQLDVHSHLHEDVIMTSSNYFRLNRRCLDIRMQIGAFVRKLLSREGSRHLYSYFYPMLIYFFALVQYQVEKADSLVILYKRKLLSLLACAVNRKATLTNVSIEINSVALQVSIERESVGNIIHSSLNHYFYLGQSAEPMERRNIHDFMPQLLADIHRKVMLTTDPDSILNRNRRQLILDSTGDVKPVVVTVKLCPTIVDHVTAYTLLTFPPDTSESLMILDDQLQIIAADSGLNKILVSHAEVFSQDTNTMTFKPLAKLNKTLYCYTQILANLFELRTNQNYEASEESDFEGAGYFRDKIVMQSEVLFSGKSSHYFNLSQSGSNDILNFNGESVEVRYEYQRLLGVTTVHVFIKKSAHTGQDFKELKNQEREK